MAPEPIMSFVPLDGIPSPRMNLNSDAKTYQIKVRLEEEKPDEQPRRTGRIDGRVWSYRKYISWTECVYP